MLYNIKKARFPIGIGLFEVFTLPLLSPSPLSTLHSSLHVFDGAGDFKGIVGTGCLGAGRL